MEYVRVSVKSPLLKHPRELELEQDCRVKDLVMAVKKEFGRKRVILLLGRAELKSTDEDKSLRQMGIVTGVTINVLCKLNAGPLGGLAPNTNSLSTESKDSTNPNSGPRTITADGMAPSKRFGINLHKPSTTPVSSPFVNTKTPAELAAEKKSKTFLRNLVDQKNKTRLQQGRARPVVAKAFSMEDVERQVSPSTPVSAAANHHAPSTDTLPSVSQRPPFAELLPASSKSVVLPSSSVEMKTPPSKSVEESRNAKCCASCDKLLPSILLRAQCRCDLYFCAKHRSPERHKCAFDYKTAGKTAIAKNNPKLSKDTTIAKGSPRL